MKLSSVLSVLFLGMCVSYFAVSTYLLSKLDIPDWGVLKAPKYVKHDERLPITVVYQHIEKPAQIFVVFEYRDAKGKYCGQQHHLHNILTIYGSGELDYELPLSLPKDAMLIRVSAGLHEVPENHTTSIYKTPKRAPALFSSWVPVVRSDVPPDTHVESIIGILHKAYQQGFWREYRGDYSLAGWVLTFGYLFCAVLLFLCLKNSAFTDFKEKLFWVSLFGIIVLFAINKQLDLQLLITDIARTAAKEYQVYEQRKPFQIRVIALFASIALGLFGLVSVLVWKSHKTLLLALTGVAVIFGYFVLRLVSYHAIEEIMKQRYVFISLYDVLELAGVALVGVGVLWYNRTHKHTTRS